jgi:hypothetical protein
VPVPSHSFPSLTYRILHDPFRTTGDVEISRLQNVAIRKEIGEQLAICMQPKPAGMPPHLMMLMRRLRDEPLTSARLIRSIHGVRHRSRHAVERCELARYPCLKGAAMIDVVALGRR